MWWERGCRSVWWRGGVGVCVVEGGGVGVCGGEGV